MGDIGVHHISDKDLVLYKILDKKQASQLKNGKNLKSISSKEIYK